MFPLQKGRTFCQRLLVEDQGEGQAKGQRKGTFVLHKESQSQRSSQQLGGQQ